jgi:hypothetical protein
MALRAEGEEDNKPPFQWQEEAEEEEVNMDDMVRRGLCKAAMLVEEIVVLS